MNNKCNVVKRVEMSNTQQKKDGKEPTIWHTIGIGVAPAVFSTLVWLIISAIGNQPPISFTDILDKFSIPVIKFPFCVCVIGAFAGKFMGKSFRSIWIGAIIGFFIPLILILMIYFLFLFYLSN